jgi:hypothetical protein
MNRRRRRIGAGIFLDSRSILGFPSGLDSRLDRLPRRSRCCWCPAGLLKMDSGLIYHSCPACKKLGRSDDGKGEIGSPTGSPRGHNRPGLPSGLPPGLPSGLPSGLPVENEIVYFLCFLRGAKLCKSPPTSPNASTHNGGGRRNDGGSLLCAAAPGRLPLPSRSSPHARVDARD